MSTFRQKVQATTDWGKPDPAEAAQTSGKSARKPRRSAQPPITANRLFPVLAALWFAALFGLGSLAISSEALGALVTLIGLPALVPAAAPPLGFTAHVLVSFALTMLGGGLGLLLGLRLRPAASKTAAPATATAAGTAAATAAAATLAAASEPAGVPKVRARDAHPDAPPRRPLVLTEAFADPHAPEISEQMHPVAPLLRRKPGETTTDAPVGQSEPWIPVYTPGGAAAAEPLDLGALDLIDVDDVLVPAPAAVPLDLHVAAPFAVAESVAEVADVVAEIGQVEIGRVEPVTEVPAPPALIAATPQLPSGFAFSQPSDEDGVRSPVAGSPLEGLGLVQLVERLALAISARKAANDAVPPPPSEGAEPDLSAGLPEAVPAVVVTATASIPASDTPCRSEPVGSAREAIMRRLGVTATQAPAEPELAPFSRPAQIVPKDPAMADSAAALMPGPRLEPLPSVLSAPAPRPISGAAGRFSAPNAFPAAPVQAESDEALRTALATLQRMTARG